METALAKKPVNIKVLAPMLSTLNKVLMEGLKKNLTEVEEKGFAAIEKGVESDDSAAFANEAVTESNQAIKAFSEVRKCYTRLLDDRKDLFIEEERRLIKKTSDNFAILKNLLLDRTWKIQEEKARIQREAAEKQRTIDEAAKKREEHNRNISIGKGGTGEVKPVIPEKIIAPVAHIGMRSTTRTRWNVDKEKIRTAVEAGVRQIPGVKIYQAWTFVVEEAKRVPKKVTVSDVEYECRTMSLG